MVMHHTIYKYLSPEEHEVARRYLAGEPFDLPEYYHKILVSALYYGTGVTALEKNFGWPVKSAKAILHVILAGMVEGSNSHGYGPRDLPEETDDCITPEEELAYYKDTINETAAKAMIDYGLTGTQSRIFAVLDNAEPRIVSKSAIICRAWGLHGDEPYDETVDQHVFHMRKKLEPHGIKIVAHWGVGFSIKYEDK